MKNIYIWINTKVVILLGFFCLLNNSKLQSNINIYNNNMKNDFKIKNIRLQTRVSQKEIDALGGRKNTLLLLKAIIRMNLENKLELIDKYLHQKNNFEI